MRKGIRGIGYAFALTLALVLINFLPVTSLRTRAMQKYTIDGITVFAEQKDYANAERIVSTIQTSSQRIHEALGIQEDQHIDLYIYPDRKALHRKTIGFVGWFLPDWYIGRNSSGSVFITSPSEPGPEHSRESIEKAAVHEYVHAMTDRQNKHMGYWMKEAFALYLADQEPSLSSLRASRQITFAEYKSQNPLEFANVGGYSLSFNYMQFLIEEFGWERVLGFLNPGKTFEEITGRDEEEVFQQWKLSLNSI
ncbi:MAG: hypothetical protein JEY71_03445 [Sphaerochaeta sp.]|nr:hypothetical protein [Sphaerochaeta sp.]